MSIEGKFRFQMEDLPEQVLDLARAEIVIFKSVGNSDAFGVNVQLEAEARTVMAPDPDYPEEPPIDYRIAPVFFTEWWDVAQGDLRSRGLDALDGLGFEVDATRADQAPYVQSPAAVYQDSYAGLNRGTLTLRHRGAGVYDAQARGETEFRWTFAVEAVAPLARVVFRAGLTDDARAPSDAVAQEFERHFDPALFAVEWLRRGSDEHFWYDYVATPLGSGQ
ncbi:hypothetical protein [Gymnodinialimonas ulvae]|uniref:hypothetical protein n=1 Tax=Gymnodinialimonas ulvae TaxID=3126504 RepID=UPI0030A33E4A